MDNVLESFEALKTYMIQNYDAKLASGGKEIVKRCHICGDSKDSSSRHMYIGVRNGVIVYNCFKCNSKGIVDGKFLRNLGCYDQNIINACNTQNLNNNHSTSSYYNAHRNVFSIKPVIPVFNDEYSMKKLKYLYNRIGCDFSSLNASRFKIILNLKQFLDYNNISNYTRNPTVMDLLDKYFIGFLSADNSYVILRKLAKDGVLPDFINYRYINYNIFGSNGTKYYIIPNAIYHTIPMEVHIAEGIIDILSIYTNIASIGANGIFMAVCGKSYEEAIKFIITKYGLIKFNLHLYLDNDVNDDVVLRINNLIKPFNIKTFIHRNEYQEEKDFGVPKSRIMERVYTI